MNAKEAKQQSILNKEIRWKEYNDAKQYNRLLQRITLSVRKGETECVAPLLVYGDKRWLRENGYSLKPLPHSSDNKSTVFITHGHIISW